MKKCPCPDHQPAGCGYIAKESEAVCSKCARAGHPKRRRTYDHNYEPGAYQVCRRCGDNKHGPAGSPIVP